MFTGLFGQKKPGEYPYLVLDGRRAELRSGRPPVDRIRHEVSFGDLPDDARREVLAVYRKLWGFEDG